MVWFEGVQSLQTTHNSDEEKKPCPRRGTALPPTPPKEHKLRVAYGGWHARELVISDLENLVLWWSY